MSEHSSISQQNVLRQTAKKWVVVWNGQTVLVYIP